MIVWMKKKRSISTRRQMTFPHPPQINVYKSVAIKDQKPVTHHWQCIAQRTRCTPSFCLNGVTNANSILFTIAKVARYDLMLVVGEQCNSGKSVRPTEFDLTVQ
jgi:hypothetical protein